MDFFLQAAKSTLSIPEPLPPATSTHHGHHTHHPHPTGTPLPPPRPEYPNGPHSPIHVAHAHETGKRALWVFFAMFTISMVVVLLMAKRVERKLRLFHLITATILGMAMLSYLTMANGLFTAIVPVYHHAKDGARVARQLFYARYIDWLFTTPLLLLDLALLSGLPLITTVMLMLADVAMILVGLFAALSHGGEKVRWFMYAISNAFYLYVLFTLVFSGRSAAKLQSSGVQRVYNVTSLMVIVLWTGYPIIFALTEGTGKISVDAEIIAYGVLDVMAKIVFGFYLLIAHSHSEGDSVVISDFFTQPRGANGGYGAIGQDD